MFIKHLKSLKYKMTTTSNIKLTNEQLLQFSKNHLCYEINTLYAAISLFVGYRENREDGFSLSVKNLFMEGVILHSRCIYEFLYSEHPRKDDALAEHFFDSKATWKGIRPSTSKQLSKLKFKTGKKIAHLTYSRLDLSKDARNWDLYIITHELMIVLTIFAENASSKKLDPEVLKTIIFWQERLGHEAGQINR